MLKPADDERTVAWLGPFLTGLDTGGRFRVAPPIVATDGRWTVEGWSATPWLEGAHVAGSWDRIQQVAADLHAATATADVEWPAFFREHRTPWAVGDRVAFNEEELPEPVLPLVAEVLHATAALRSRPTSEPDQVIHGDLAGNVVFADEAKLPPAVIDFSPYFRPAGFAAAIAVADAVAWEGAPLTLAIRFATTRPDGDAHLARALAFRAADAAGLWPNHPARVEAEVVAYHSVLTVLRL